MNFEFDVESYSVIFRIVAGYDGIISIFRRLSTCTSSYIGRYLVGSAAGYSDGMFYHLYLWRLFFQRRKASEVVPRDGDDVIDGTQVKRQNPVA